MVATLESMSSMAKEMQELKIKIANWEQEEVQYDMSSRMENAPTIHTSVEFS